MVYESQATILKLAAGGAASASAKTLVAPFERVKLLLQVGRGGAAHPGVVATLRSMVRNEGAWSLWRGNGTNCVRIVPTYALRFALFDRFRDAVSPAGYRDAGRVQSLQPLPLERQMAAAALSGASAALVTHPLDLLRTRISTSTSASPLRSALAHGNMYRGIGVSLAEITPYIAISLGGFEWLKARVAQRGIVRTYGDGEAVVKVTALQSLGCGWASGLVASLVCYPLDTVKRRLMVAQRERSRCTVRSVATQLWVEGGSTPVLFYRGCAVNALKSSPAAAITFTLNDVFRQSMGVD